MNKTKNTNETIGKKERIIVTLILTAIVIISYFINKILIINWHFNYYGLPSNVRRILQITIPLLIYIYYDQKSSNSLYKFMSFYLLRCLLIYTITLIFEFNKYNIFLFFIFSYLMYYVTTFLPYNLSFIKNTKINSIKISLLLTKKKIFILIFYDVMMILISILVLLHHNKGLLYYIFITNVFFNYEIKRYYIWKREVN